MNTFPRIISVAAMLAITLVQAHADVHTELAREMKAMGRDLKNLSKQIGVPDQKTSSLELIARIKAGAEKSRTLTPAKAEEVADKEKFIAEYKQAIGALIEAYGKIEAALKADNFAEAEKLCGQLKEIKREGHEKFSSED